MEGRARQLAQDLQLNKSESHISITEVVEHGKTKMVSKRNKFIPTGTLGGG